MISIRSPECQALAYNCKLDPLGASVLMSLSRVLSSVDPIGSRELQGVPNGRQNLQECRPSIATAFRSL